MKNGKEFDYDKKKPNFEGNNVKKSIVKENEKVEDLSTILNKSHISKNVEVIQRDSISKEKKGKAFNGSGCVILLTALWSISVPSK